MAEPTPCGISPFEVNEGEIVTLIGANGAGRPRRCTALQVLKISTAEKIYYEDKDISKWEAQTKVKNRIDAPTGGTSGISGFPGA